MAQNEENPIAKEFKEMDETYKYWQTTTNTHRVESIDCINQRDSKAFDMDKKED